MVPIPARASIDWLVLTAANRRQAKAYAAQLSARAERGVLANAEGVIVVPDACDARIGSGAATVLALVQVARQLAQRKQSTTMLGLFTGVRVLMLHSGGDSRRLPMYGAEGKLFASVPMRGAGGKCATVIDVLIDDLMSIPARAGGEVLIGAGDAVIGIARDPIRFDGEGVIGVAQRADVGRAVRHGVFVCEGESEEVARFLQKPSEIELRAAGAIAGDGLARVDTGLMSLDPPSVAALLKGCGVSLARSGEITLKKGGFADLVSRAELPAVDLYREILMALPAQSTRSDYLETCAPGVLAKPLGAYFDAMRTTRFSVKTATVSEFLHIGSTREILTSLVGPNAPAHKFGVGIDWTARGLLHQPTGNGHVLVLGGAVARVHIQQGCAILDRVAVGDVTLGGENVLVGISTPLPLTLPRGVSLFGVPVEDVGDVYATCGLNDNFKTRLDAGGTLLDQPFADFCACKGISSAQVAQGDGTLWDARLWCVADGSDPLALVRWMWEDARAPQAWRDAERLTMREIVECADLEEIASRRDEVARALITAHPLVSLTEAIDATDARFVHEILVETQDSIRLRVLQRGAEELLELASPIARAHGAATLAELSGLTTVHGAALRGVAFHAVGEAVLSHFEPQKSPIRAAILPDQAVWTSMPVRIDLAGGWTDTPPICNEIGGSVVNVAVMLRGQLPIQVVAKLEEPTKGAAPVIRITSTDLGQTREIRTMADLAQRSDPTRWSALAESALVLAGIVPSDPKASLANWLETLGGGLSLTIFSAVPKGSGLGTSSVLGAAAIHCLDRVLGRARSQQELFAASSALEQMLSTRGGWQDQVGGVVGGFKIARTQPGSTQQPSVESIAVPAPFLHELHARSLLYFTGERRMAKNILENVVWNWLVHEPRAVKAVERLRTNAERMRNALAAGDIDATIGELTQYMKRKRQIDPGSCPQSFDDLAARWKDELSAWCFAGAGGGGFMLLIAKDAHAAEALRTKIDRDPPHPRARAFEFEVDQVGLRCAVV